MKNITWKTLVNTINAKTNFEFRGRVINAINNTTNGTLIFANNSNELIIHWNKNCRTLNGSYDLAIVIIPMKARTKGRRIYHTRGKAKNEIYRNFLRDQENGKIPELS